MIMYSSDSLNSGYSNSSGINLNIRIIRLIRAKRINLCKIKLINQSNICRNLLVQAQGIITVAINVTYADILRQHAIYCSSRITKQKRFNIQAFRIEMKPKRFGVFQNFLCKRGAFLLNQENLED